MKGITCDNCHARVDDYYYKGAGLAIQTCSLSCMAEFLCENNIGDIKLHLDAAKKIILTERAI